MMRRNVVTRRTSGRRTCVRWAVRSSTRAPARGPAGPDLLARGRGLSVFEERTGCAAHSRDGGPRPTGLAFASLRAISGRTARPGHRERSPARIPDVIRNASSDPPLPPPTTVPGGAPVNLTDAHSEYLVRAAVRRRGRREGMDGRFCTDSRLTPRDGAVRRQPRRRRLIGGGRHGCGRPCVGCAVAGHAHRPARPGRRAGIVGAELGVLGHLTGWPTPGDQRGPSCVDGVPERVRSAAVARRHEAGGALGGAVDRPGRRRSRRTAVVPEFYLLARSDVDG